MLAISSFSSEGSWSVNPVIREACYSDCEAIGALKRRNGLSTELTTDRWVGLWRENPAMPQDQSVPIGWVLEHEGNVVGYLGNIPIHYEFRGKRLLAAAASGFAVDTEYRSHSLRLSAAFFSQKNVDFLLNTTANMAVGTVFQLCKAQKISQADYDKALLWIVDMRGFATSLLRHRGHGARVSAFGGAMLAPALRFAALFRKHGRVRLPEEVAACETSVLEANAIGVAFDEFWQRTLADRAECLLADRSARALRWHFGPGSARARQTRIVCAWRASRLAGYAALTHEDTENIGLTRSRIADLIADGDDPDIIDALLHATFQQARADGSHVLELIGFPKRIRARSVAGGAYVRQLPSWPFWYKVVAPDLSESFSRETTWYGCSYDGDASL
jgi:hypothetical protein